VHYSLAEPTGGNRQQAGLLTDLDRSDIKIKFSDRLNSSNYQMNLEQAILSQSKKVDRALETLKANRRYQQDKLT
jgi:hypothetical protein